MSPASSFCGLLGRVLGIRDEGIGIFYEIDNPLLVLACGFVIREEDETVARRIQTVAKASAWMVCGTGGDANVFELQVCLPLRFELLCIEVAVASQHADPVVFYVSGNKEREALNVVPVGMGIEKCNVQGGGAELSNERASQRADSRAGIDDHNFILEP